MDLELRGFKGSLRFLKTWEGTWDENCKIASKVREKNKANLKEKGSWVDDVDGGGVLEGGSVMGMGTEIRRGGMWYSGGSA